jgi:hypothetical protein
MSWLRRLIGDPVTFTDERMFRMRVGARTHVTAERFKITNPRFYLARIRASRRTK